jgi:hypothetical protein
MATTRTAGITIDGNGRLTINRFKKKRTIWKVLQHQTATDRGWRERLDES